MAAAELQECPSPTAPHGSCTERRVRRGCSPYILCINFYTLQKNKKTQPSTVLLLAYLIRIQTYLDNF